MIVTCARETAWQGVTGDLTYSRVRIRGLGKNDTRARI